MVPARQAFAVYCILSDSWDVAPGEPTMKTMLRQHNGTRFAVHFVVLLTGASAAFSQDCIDSLCFVDRGQTGEIVLGQPRGGLSVIDFDNDGWQDLVIADLPPSTTLLFRNVPDPVNPKRRNFQNVTAGSGLNDADNVALSFSVLVADYDNDGFQDVFLSGQGAGGGYGRLYRNNGNGTFTNVSVSSGVRALAISVLSASFNDVDLDGDLDLLLVPSSGSPVAPRLLLNNGNGTFSNGGSLLPALPAMGTVYAHGWMDYDGDGWHDCFIPGTGAPVILKNVSDGNGGRRFVNSAGAAGFVSLGPAPMGVAFGDHDNDGDFDICFTDATGGTYYNDLGDTLVRVFPFSTIFGWGTSWFDIDNDGLLDNYQCGSHSGANFNRLHRNLGGGMWQDVSGILNSPFASSQHSVLVDFNNDGRQDLITINPGNPPHVVSVNENISSTNNRWFAVKLVGDGVSVNRDAVGAVVRVYFDGFAHIRQVASGTSTNATEDMRVHFGLGPADTVDSVEVLWPRLGTLAERTEVYAGPFVTDQIITLTVGAAACDPVHGDVHPVGPPTGNCLVTLDDILCVLNGFSQPLTCPGADLVPCGGNGLINLDDILSVLAAFGGAHLCR